MKHTPDNPNACPVCSPNRCEVARRREQKVPKPRPMTAGQRRVLGYAAKSKPLDTGFVGMSQYGGLAVIVQSLRRRGWLDREDKITPEGAAALKREASK